VSYQKGSSLKLRKSSISKKTVGGRGAPSGRTLAGGSLEEKKLVSGQPNGEAPRNHSGPYDSKREEDIHLWGGESAGKSWPCGEDQAHFLQRMLGKRGKWLHPQYFFKSCLDTGVIPV